MIDKITKQVMQFNTDEAALAKWPTDLMAWDQTNLAINKKKT
jgi:hypothetical protein